MTLETLTAPELVSGNTLKGQYALEGGAGLGCFLGHHLGDKFFSPIWISISRINIIGRTLLYLILNILDTIP
jgi:hypothetical protein